MDGSNISVSIRVVDAKGAPIEGAHVNAEPYQPGHSVLTNAHGLAELSASKKQAISIGTAGYSQRHIQVHEIAVSEERPFTVVMKKRATMEISIIDTEGAELENVGALFSAVDHSETLNWKSTQGGRGVFHGSHDQTYLVLHLSIADRVVTRVLTRVIHSADEIKIMVKTIPIPKQRKTPKIRCWLPDGSAADPAPGGWFETETVSWPRGHAPAISKQDGCILVDYPWPSDIETMLWAPGCAAQSLRLKDWTEEGSDSRTIDITLSKPTTIEGTVVGNEEERALTPYYGGSESKSARSRLS